MSKLRYKILWNQGSANVGIVWDAFKVYIRGVIISFKAHREKDRSRVMNMLIDEIQKLEELNKAQVKHIQSEH